MRNRWYHRATLHVGGDGVEKRATWLELFYDLIFVAAFIQLGEGLAGHVSWDGFALFGGVFACLWIAWTGFTFFVNRFTVDDLVHRLAAFVQMFSVGAMAVTAHQVLEGNRTPFALSFAVAQVMVGLFYLRAWRQVPEGRAYAAYWGLVFLGAGGLWAASVLVPGGNGHILWPIGVLVVLASPLSKRSRQLEHEYPIDQEHLSERYGLLTLIVLGESFVKVLSSLRAGDTEWQAILQMSTSLLITCCIWWIYFDDVAGSRVKKQRLAGTIWLYAHLPLQIAVTGVGVAIKSAVHFDLSVPAPEGYRWLLAGTLGLTMLSVAVIDSVTERRQAELSDRARVNVRSASAVLMLLLAPAGGGMSALTFMILVTTVCVSQVVFDLMMAPLEAMPTKVEMVTTSELARRRAAGDLTAIRSRRAVSDAVRKGAPAELRRDFYFWFIEGSWKRFFLALLFLYVTSNVFFAGLYMLEPGCIHGARLDSFPDAFFFSVQTLSTIGYGAMSPASTYGNFVVTAEAAIGLAGVALATGLLLAKVSRPRSSALFSNVMVVTSRNGVPHLVFRVGNARGNEVVDATCTLTLLRDEFTEEGEHMRRLHDLALVRARQPMFILGWTVMHALDENSPLRGVDFSDRENASLSIIVTILGHDGTYGQTVYARHIYYADDIRMGHRFVDVVSQLTDGRTLVDYERWHDTEPLA